MNTHHDDHEGDIQNLLNSHGAALRGAGLPGGGGPPPAFISAVRNRRRNIVLTRVGAAVVLLGLAAVTMQMLGNLGGPSRQQGPRETPVVAQTSQDEWIERELLHRSGEVVRTASKSEGLNPRERRILRPGVRDDLEELHEWLGNI